MIFILSILVNNGDISSAFNIFSNILLFNLKPLLSSLSINFLELIIVFNITTIYCTI